MAEKIDTTIDGTAVRKLLVKDGGFVWIDKEYGVKWHLMVAKKEPIEDPKAEEPETIPELKHTSGLSEWLKK